MRTSLRAFVWLCLLIAAACTAAPSTVVVNPTDGVITLAQAQQADAPALATSVDGVTAVWIGSDERGVHQDARRLTNAGLSEITTLPLPPTHPYDQMLITGEGGRLHLLWLDADQDGETNLYGALITPELQVERGPIALSEGLALRYTAVADGVGGLWVAWSGGLLSEMNIYTRRIDSDGRPLLTMTVAENASDPALVRTAAGEIWLFWLADGQVIAQQLDANGSAHALTSAISLAAGDILVNTGVALDTTAAYYYWNVTRADGTNQTWISAGALTADAWQQPQRLRVDTTALSEFAPLAGQQSLLRAVAQTGSDLGLVNLHAGAIVDYKPLVQNVTLLGLPTLVADSAGGVYVAWSAPGDAAADLRIFRVAQ